MATSYTEFRGHGFWSHDLHLELVLLLLSREISTTHSPPWLLEARDDWFLQATAGFHGCVSADLDQILGEDTGKLALVHELCGRARMALLEYHPRILHAEFAGFGLGSRIDFASDVDVPKFLPVSDAFDHLLAGRLRWDNPATSPVL